MKTRAFIRLVVIGSSGRRRLGTILFVFVVALATAAIVAGLETRRSAGRTWDRAFDRADGPHVIVSASTPDALADVAADPRAERSSSPIAQAGAQLVTRDARADLVLRAAAATSLPTVGAPYLIEGRLADAPSQVALEKSLVDDLGIAIGDQITVAVGQRTIQFDVVGVVLDFQDCFYPQCDTGVAWVDPSGLPPGAPVWFSTLLRLRDPSSAAVVSADMLRSGGGRLTGVQDWLDTRRDALVIDEFFGAFLAGFGVFVLIAAGIVVAASVTNRVLARRRDIALEKAIGVTPRQFVAALIVEHLSLGGIGLVVGCIVGAVATPTLRIGVTKVLDSDGAALHTTSAVFAAIVIAAIIVVATAAPALRIARATTTQSLRAPSGDQGRTRLASVVSWSGGGPVAIAGLKDAFGRPVRATLTVLSIMLAVVALLVTLGLHRSVDEVNGRPALAGDPWDVSISSLGDADPTEVLTRLGAIDGVRSAYYESSSRRVVDGEVVLVRAVGGAPTDAGYIVRDGRRMSAAGEAMAGYGLLDRLGKQVGDTVTVDVDGYQLPVTIVGRYAETEDSGEVLLIRWESITSTFPEARPDAYFVTAEANMTRTELVSRLRTSLGPSATVDALTVESDDLDAFFVAFWLVAALVLIVAFANLASTILLGVRERSRELGVLRTIGFSPAQSISSTSLGTVALATTAIVLGLPVGLAVNAALTSNVGRAIGYGPELGTSPGVVAAGVAIAVVALCALSIGIAAAASAARRSASELIRYE